MKPEKLNVKPIHLAARMYADESPHGMKAVHSGSLLLRYGQFKQDWLIYLIQVDQ